MNTPQNPNSAFTLLELLVVLVVLGILIAIATPNVAICIDRGRYTETLANAKSLRDTTLMMARDRQASGEKNGLNWTSMEKGFLRRPATLAEYFDAMLRDGYMTQSELKKVLSAPGKTPVACQFTADSIAFKIFQVAGDSPDDQPLLVTANWKYCELTDQMPYGKKGFVVFNKGGGGGIYKRAQDAESPNIFPGAGAGKDGATYNYVSLK